MNAFEQTANKEPTAEQRSKALRNLVIGCILAVVVGKLSNGLVDREMLANPVWVYGQYLSIVLFGWIGWLIGLRRERVVTENIESLAIAVVMALILKYFLVEAYKIPTGSMQPTILGNETAGIFDRVLVNKFAFLVDEPKRYDVIVFKYPLNRTQNYIKRCVGIGPEQITIQNGNIYSAPLGSDGKYAERVIARKPADVREAVMKTLYPSTYDGETFDKAFTVDLGTAKSSGEDVEFDGPFAFRFKKDGDSVRDRYLDGYDPDWGIGDDRIPADEREYVGDLDIAFEVTPRTAAQQLVVKIASNGLIHVARLGVGDGAKASLASGVRDGVATDPSAPLPGQTSIEIGSSDSPLRIGDSTEIALRHVDQEVVLEVDGSEMFRVAYEVRSALESTENQIGVEMTGGGAEIEDLRIRRDIHYLTTTGGASQSFDVPAGHYFGMGDNTQNSHDGRQWRGMKYRLKDGREIIRDSNQDIRLGMISIYGETYDVGPFGGNADYIGDDNSSFHYIPREFLLGKALAVFWPIYPTFRWKLIR